MSIIYTKQDNKLKETETSTKDNLFTIEEINSAITGIEENITILTSKKAVWEKRLAEAEKLFLVPREVIDNLEIK